MDVSEFTVAADLLTPIDDDISSILLDMERKIRNGLAVCVPAQVEEYDRDRHVAHVRRLDKEKTDEGDATDTVQMIVRVMRLQVGGMMVDPPIFPGDVGWIVAADMDTTLIRQMNDKVQQKGDMEVRGQEVVSYGEGNQGPQVANTGLTHSLGHGFFIPDSWSSIAIPDGYRDALLLQTVDRDGNSTGLVAIQQDGEVVVESDAGLSVKADTEIEGDLSVKTAVGTTTVAGNGVTMSPANGFVTAANGTLTLTGAAENCVVLGKTETTDITDTSSLVVASRGWVNKYFLRSASTAEVEVVTGISFAFDSTSNQLTATLTKKKVTVLSSADITPAPTATLPLYKQAVAVDGYYNSSAYAYGLGVKTVTGVRVEATATEEEKTPYTTATAHSAES